MTTTYGPTGVAQTQTPNTQAGLAPVNTPQKPAEILTNALRLIAVARGVVLNATGDAAVMQIINSASWAPVNLVTANGQVAGVAGSIATASIGIFTAAAGGGIGIKTQAALTNNSAVGSAISLASPQAALAFTAQSLFVNVGTALANATVDIFVYGYDLT